MAEPLGVVALGAAKVVLVLDRAAAAPTGAAVFAGTALMDLPDGDFLDEVERLLR